MNAKIITTTITAIVLFATLNVGCGAAWDPCPGEAQCGSGCMPVNSVCCADTNSYCPSQTVCGPNNTCLSDTVNGCLAMGEETCTNYDGVDDCAPLGASCCHNHTYCAVGTVCCASGCCY